MFTGRMSWRRLKVLLDGLPPESLTWTAVLERTPAAALKEAADSETNRHGPWSRMEHLLALIADGQQIQTWQYATTHSKTAPAKPKPLRRPGVAEVTPLNPAARAYLDRVRAGHGSPIAPDGGD